MVLNPPPGSEAVHGLTGFVFPNDVHVHWTIMIALYPYITGLVAGSFVISSLYYLFGVKDLKPVARFALTASLTFLLFATLPLLAHLTLPLRAHNVMITSNFTSAMAGFGFIYIGYLVILGLQLWFMVREELVARALALKGLWGLVFKALVLFDTTIDERTHAFDRRMSRFFAGMGLPAAVFLSYVGFLFGAIKANPWWSTPLMPVIFLMSAMVSGTSVIVFLYFFISWLRGVKVEAACVRTLANYLWLVTIIDVALELLEVLTMAYEKNREWSALNILIQDKLFFSFVVMQLMICSLIPFLLLGTNALLRLPSKLSNTIVFLSACLLLLQVALMRWNIIIGGQLISRSFRGYTSYSPTLLGKEGILAAAAIILTPFLLLRFFDHMLPLFPEDSEIGKRRRGLSVPPIGDAAE